MLSGDDKAFSWTFVEEDLQHCLSMSDMHNMCVSDRVMGGNLYARYNPANSLTIDEDERIENENGAEIDTAAREGRCQQIGLANAGNANVVQNVLQ